MPPESSHCSRVTTKAMDNHFIVERSPVYIQLYAVLDDPRKGERGDCTQFVMDASKDTLEDAIVFLNQNISNELWGVSHVKLVGVVPLAAWENRSVRARKVLSTIQLERVFVPTHQDCLVVIPDNVGDPIATLEESIEDTSRGIHVLNNLTQTDEVDGIKDEENAPLSPEMVVKEEVEKDYNRIRDAIGLKALIDATSPESDDKKNISYNEDSQENTTVTAENEDGHSSDGFPADLREKREEVEVTDKEGSALQESAVMVVVDEEAVANTDGAVALPGMEKVIPDIDGDAEISRPDVKKLIAKFSEFLPQTQERDEEEKDDSFPSVARDKGEDAVLTVAAVSVPLETAEKSVPVESDESKDEKDDEKDVVAEMDRVPSAPTHSEQRKEDVLAVRLCAPFGPSHQKSFGDFKPEEAASIPQPTTANGIYSFDNVQQHDDKAITNDESIVSIEKGMDTENFGITAVSGATAKSLSDTEDMENADFKLRTRPVDSSTLVDIANDTHVTNAGTSNGFNAPKDTKSTTVGADNEVACVPARDEIPTEEPMDAASSTLVNMAFTEVPLENVFKTEERKLILTDASHEGVAPDLSTSKDDSGECDYIGQSSKAAPFPLPDDAMSAASSFDNVVVVDLRASEQGLDIPSAPRGEKDLGYGESAEINEDSWKTQPDLEDSLEALFAGATEPKQEITDPNAPLNVPSLLGGIAPSESNLYEPESPPRPQARRLKSDGAPLSPRARHSARSPSSSYKIGTSYFVLRESEGIEYPVKIRSLGKSGTTCIVAYEHHRSTKKVRTSSLLPDTPERRQKFEEQMNLGLIDHKLPARIAKEAKKQRHEEHGNPGLIDDNLPARIAKEAKKQRDEEHGNPGLVDDNLPARITKEAKKHRHEEHGMPGLIDDNPPARITKEAKKNRHEEHGHLGEHISRHNLPKCYTEGTIIKEPGRRVYFAMDREPVKGIAKKFKVTSERIIYDNKSAYPNLKKTSLLRPLTSLVLPP